MLPVFGSLFVIVLIAVQQAFATLEKINLQDGNIDFNTISNAANNVVGTSDSFIFNLGLILILLCWILGTVDAYRIGRKKDLEEQVTHQI